MKDKGLANHVYFPGLNSLRFFAALSVIIAHVELIKSYFNISNQALLFDRINFGGVGVYFFFVLSGFLITYLLCAEKKKSGTIAVKQFYLRRILRIWPLYFFMLVLGFFVFPAFHFFDLMPGSFQKNFAPNLILFLFMLPNLAFACFPPVQHIAHLWSIGVEEQFYLFWPLIVKKCNNLLTVIPIITFCYLLFKVVLSLIPFVTEAGPAYFAVRKFFAMNKFESMLMGAMVAVVLFEKKKKALELLFHPFVQTISLIIFPFLSYLAGTNNLVQDAVHIPLSGLFAIIILNVASNPSSILKLEIKWLNYLGKISYGIYMYHVVIIYILVKLLFPLFHTSPIIANCIVYSCSIILSCIISHFSYQYFELFFIKKKLGYARITSGG